MPPPSKLSNLVSSAADDGAAGTSPAPEASSSDVKPVGAPPAPAASASAPAPEARARPHRVPSVLMRRCKQQAKSPSAIHWCAEPGVTTNGTASSCQLFSIFKAMATDKAVNDGESEVAVDSDSDAVSSDALSSDGTEVEEATKWGESPPIANNDDKGWYNADHRAAGDKFAAASLNSFSPIGGDHEMRDNKLEIDTKALGDMHLDDPPPSATDVSTDISTDASTSSSSLPATPSTVGGDEPRYKFPDKKKEMARFSHDDVPEEEKMAVIIGEFGDIAERMVNDDGTPAPKEHIVAESQGTLFKGVMMIGNLHLTNYRLLFHALLPPDSAFVSGAAEPDQTEEQANARYARPDILKSGNVTIHREGLIKSKKRVWMELTPEMLTTYPSGDEAGRVRPLYSILLSNALRLSPYDPSAPREFYLTYDSPDGNRTVHFSVDNEQSSNQWRRLFEGALFRQARQKFRESHMAEGIDAETKEDLIKDDERWSMIRCCVPLNRVEVEGTADFHSFATLIKLSVELESNQHLTWHPEHLADGNYDGYARRSVDLPSTPPRSKTEGETSSKRNSLLPKFRIGRSGSRDSSPVRQQSRELSRERSHEKTRASFDCANERPYWTDIDRVSGTEAPPSGVSTPAIVGYMDSAMQVTFDRECFQAHAIRTEDTEWGEENIFQMLVALMNDQRWFADSLREAVTKAHTRRYKEGATHMKMQLDVGGYDCLATDDDLEADDASIPSVDEEEDEEVGKPRFVVEARKAQKTALAARVFGLRESEGIWLKRCYLGGVMPARGHIILSPRYLCFWRRANVGSDIKYRFASQDIRSVHKYTPRKVGMHGLAVQIHGHQDLLFDFWNPESRNQVMRHIEELIEPKEKEKEAKEKASDSESSILTSPTLTDGPASPMERGEPAPSAVSVATTASEAPLAMWENARNVDIGNERLAINPKIGEAQGESIQQAAKVLAPPPDLLMYPQAMSDEALSYMPFVANRPYFSRTGWNVRLTPRRFTMLTIGSRGDVQPYIALALRLMEDGHTCVIVTHDEFKKWIEGYGIEHRQAGGDPTALMKLSTEHAMFSPGFFKEALGGFRRWLDELLIDSWHACQDADVLIESPSTMAGIHIAEALEIPYFRAFTMPWTRTTAYPQAFMVPKFEMGPSFNYSTYVLFDNIIWRASSGQINKWRKKYLHLKATDQSILSVSKVPFLYNFSPAVVPKPLDWNDDITITGYWNLDNSDMEWTPPDSLIEFMAKAKENHKPIVYIGFGSIVVPDPVAMTKSIVKGVEKAGVYAIIAKGWSARGEDASKSEHIEMSDACYSVDKVPHSWLFPKIQAALHHGGAGTTGASLRAGLPTLIKPWFGDQYFWGLRVTKLGVGLKLGSLRSDDIAAALKKATTDRIMIEKASRIGERISSESGVDTALNVINSSIMRAARNRHDLKKKESAEACTERPLYKAFHPKK